MDRMFNYFNIFNKKKMHKFKILSSINYLFNFNLILERQFFFK